MTSVPLSKPSTVYERECHAIATGPDDIDIAIDAFFDGEPSAHMIVITRASYDALEYALERGDGLSQRVCDFLPEAMKYDIEAIRDGLEE